MDTLCEGKYRQTGSKIQSSIIKAAKLTFHALAWPKVIYNSSRYPWIIFRHFLGLIDGEWGPVEPFPPICPNSISTAFWGTLKSDG